METAIIHNRNFGGSGGFTRAMIEYVDEGIVDYILLMDDDIMLESSALERSYSLICGLKEQYKENFLGGAMLSMERPIMQYENTAYWNRIISTRMNHWVDLTKRYQLINNGNFTQHANQYSGWWYCCIPVNRIQKIGYPLPAFIKSDDIEYSIRNGKEILTLNGIAVWHEIFTKKMSLSVRYYSDRNSFILNHYAHGCGLGTLLLAILGRICKRLIHGDIRSIQLLAMAIEEYSAGFNYITQTAADHKMKHVIEMTKEPLKISICLHLTAQLIEILLKYNCIDMTYKVFKRKQLQTSVFWKRYLRIK